MAWAIRNYTSEGSVSMSTCDFEVLAANIDDPNLTEYCGL